MSGQQQAMGMAGQSLGTMQKPQGQQPQGMDLKEPLAKFALQMAMQKMMPKPGLQIGGGIQNPYGPR